MRMSESNRGRIEFIKRNRERDSLIRELESKLDGTLEQLELVKT